MTFLRTTEVRKKGQGCFEVVISDWWNRSVAFTPGCRIQMALVVLWFCAARVHYAVSSWSRCVGVFGQKYYGTTVNWLVVLILIVNCSQRFYNSSIRLQL